MFNDVRILKMQKLASIGSLHASAYLYILKRKKKKENFVYTL